MPPRLALSWMPEPAFARAATPLLAEGAIDALEWSFDTVWRRPADPARDALLTHFGDAGRLVAHGVGYSLLSADDAPERRRAWLSGWRRERATRRYAHLSEHFGFMRAPGYRRGPPLPLPPLACVVALGRENLARLADASDAPVGLENLAFGFCARDCLEQGELLERLLAPTGGFLVLDLHNLWCQAVNFGLDPLALLASYPLDRVRELHVSGGRWAETAHGRVRRDTHDSGVPPEVLALLDEALARCTAARLVVVERLGDTFDAPHAAAELRADVAAVRAALSRREAVPGALASPAAPPAPWTRPPQAAPSATPGEAGALWAAQGALFAALAAREAPPLSMELLGEWLSAAAPSMWETATDLMARWAAPCDAHAGR